MKSLFSSIQSIDQSQGKVSVELLWLYGTLQTVINFVLLAFL